MTIQVIAFRHHGFDQEIRIKATNLPAGVTASEATIGPGKTTALLELRAAAGAAPVRGNLGLVAEATVDGQVISRPGRFGVVNWQGTMQQGNNPGNASVSRLAPGLLVAISEIENGIVGLEFGDGNIVEASRAANIKLTYKRRGEFKGKLTMNAVDFPANVDAKQLVINANADNGEYTIGLKANTPPGTYTVYFNGTAEKVKYSRNPEAVVVAQEKKKKVDQIKAEADAVAAGDWPRDDNPLVRAFVEAGTAAAMRAAGVDPRGALQRNDAFGAFEAIDALFHTGPTGTNVNDFRALLIGDLP